MKSFFLILLISASTAGALFLALAFYNASWNPADFNLTGKAFAAIVWLAATGAAFGIILDPENKA